MLAVIKMTKAIKVFEARVLAVVLVVMEVFKVMAGMARMREMALIRILYSGGVNSVAVGISISIGGRDLHKVVWQILKTIFAAKWLNIFVSNLVIILAN